MPNLAAQRRTNHIRITCNFPYQSLKGQLPNQKLCGFLVSSDLLQSNSPWSKSMRFLHPSFRSLHTAFLCCFGCLLPLVLHALLPFSLLGFSLAPLELPSGILFFVLDSRLVYFLLRWFSSGPGGIIPKFG